MPARADIVLATIGRCIYCRSTESLSDEHIVPAGLDGYAVLRAASCSDCAKKTSAIESRVLGDLRHFRGALGLGSRRRKKTPKGAPVQSYQGERLVTHYVEFDRHIPPIFMPVFPPPRCKAREEGSSGLDLVGLQLIGYEVDTKRSPEKLEVPEFHLKYPNYHAAFARMLAKIAYSYAVSEVGLDAFAEVFVLPAILGRSDDIGRWVGTYAKEMPKCPDPEVWHQLNILVAAESETGPGPMVAAHVQLFSNSPSPGYEVVVGTMHRGARLPEKVLLGLQQIPNLRDS